MMPNAKKYLTGMATALFAVAVFCQSVAVAQNLPKLAQDKNVKAGVLDNGIRYYVVENSAGCGLTDLALVRRGVAGFPEDFDFPSVQRFNGNYILRNRFAVGPDGYVQKEGDAVIIGLRDVPMALDQKLADSTCLYMLSLVEQISADGHVSDNAIVVAGDLKADEFISSLKTLSLLVPSGASSGKFNFYNWESTPGCRYSTSRSVDGRPHARIEFRAPRLPRENMATVLPIVSHKMAGELCELMKIRIEAALKLLGIEYESVSTFIKTSADGPGDEVHGIDVYADDSELIKIACVLFAETAHASEGDFTVEEYEPVRASVSTFMEMSSDVRSNAEWVRACTAAFLYDAGIPSQSDVMSMVVRRQLDAKQALDSFNAFAKAFLAMDHDLELSCNYGGEPLLGGLELKGAIEEYMPSFNAAHEAGDPHSSRICGPEQLPGMSFKVKLASKVEPLSGGTLMTLPGGMRIIYKKMQTGGKMHFRFAVPGGTSLLDLPKGMNASDVSNMFSSWGFSGMTASEADRMLMSEGVSMKKEITPSAVLVSGCATSKSVNIMLRALLGVANNLNPLDGDDEFVSYFENWTRQRFMDCSSSVLVLVGDMSETDLQKILTVYAGGFHFSSVKAKDPAPTYAVSKNVAVIRREAPGARYGARIEAEVACQISLDNLLAGRICEMALAGEIASLAPIYADISADLDIYSNGRYRFCIDLTGVQDPSSPFFMDSDAMVKLALQAISNIASGSLDRKTMDKYKTILSKRLAYDQDKPEYWADAITTRYTDGKDFHTSSKERIKALSSDAIARIFRDFLEGGRIETVFEPIR